MALNILYPTNAAMRVIGPAKVARAAEERLGFKILPLRQKKVAILTWQQRDNNRGLQQLRGSGGTPAKVDRRGWSKKLVEPGYFGEYTVIEEDELNKRAGANPDAAVDASDLVLADQDLLTQRELDLIEYIIFRLLVAGTFTITGPTGLVYTETYGVQTHTGSDWSTSGSATPMKDLRTVRSTKGVGKGLNFGRGAMAIMNSITAQYMFDNSNSADLGGKFQNGSALNIDQNSIDRVLVAQDLPDIVIYDEGYYDESNTYQYYVPTDKVAIVGKRRDGEELGEYTQTINQYAPNGVGGYDFIKDSFKGINCAREVPGQIQVHKGHNGGVQMWHPGGVVVMSV